MPRKKKSKIKQGKRDRAAGARFELKVRGNLESDGWILDKWSNNVALEEGKLIKAKRKYNPYKKVLSIGTGFPDFMAFRPAKSKGKNYEVIGIEVKRKGLLDKSEKEKCAWYLKNKIFSKILIAKSVQEGRRIRIEYIDFKEKYNNL